MITTTKMMKTHRTDTEHEAESVVEDYKNRAAQEGYTVSKTKVDYKTKKDRKTGDIIEEWWVVEITVSYDV